MAELTIDQALQQGMAAHKAGQIQEADRIYTAILKAQPKHPDANHNMGVLAVGVGKVEQALPFLKTALEANPATAQFWLSYIDALIKLDKVADAKAVLDQAKSKGAKGNSFDKLEQRLKEASEEPLAACKTPAEAPSQQPNILDSLKLDQAISLAKKKAKDGSPEEAKRIYQDILTKFPKNKRASDGLKALASRPVSKASKAQDPPQDQLQSLINLHSQGQLQQALKQAETLVQQFPNSPILFNIQGAVLRGLGQLDLSVEAYNRALAIKPDYAGGYYNMGNALKEQGKLDVAIEAYNKALAIKPDHADAYSNMGMTLQEQGKLEEAIEACNKALAIKPDNAEAYNNMGVILQELDRMEDSVSSFQQAFANRTGIRPVGDDVLAPATNKIFFELTNKCNFHCTFCPSDLQKRSLGSMDLELVKQLYEENADKKIANEVNLHLMGEPTLHPALIEILKFGASKNVKTDLVTNISTLVSKNVPKILDALYGTLTASHMTPTEETYHFRGNVGLSWDRYIGNLRMLVREYMKRLAKGNATKNNITIRVMVTQNTASNASIIGSSNEAGAILKEWNDFVAEVEQELKMPPFERKDHNADDLVRGNNHASTSYLLQQGIKLTFWRAFTFANTRVSNDFDLKATRQTSYCSHPFTDVGVLWNGDVTLCCLDHDGELKVGNVRDSSIENVIQSDAAQKLRASMLGDYPLPSICQTCQERPVRREKT
ncbi:tetratricopeptide repeat protein [Planktomarina temperata]|nr:tetratricopeptide repeat protein [Planktomarina temperata]